MSDGIKVHVVDMRRRNLYMRYLCPETGKHIAKSTRSGNRGKALKAAAQWEAELNKGRYLKQPRMSWAAFREYYEESTASVLRPATVANYRSTLNAFERACRPKRLSDLSSVRVTAFTTDLRERSLSEASVVRHLRQLKAVANWAKRHGLVAVVPTFDMPKRSPFTKRMKGRPITGEEFDRMLTATVSVVGGGAAASWQLLLRGLWTSGLRLSEAMALRWDHRPGGLSINLDSNQSTLRFDAASQKSGVEQVVPLAPEAYSLLSPLASPTGYVFRPERRDGLEMARDSLKASKIISKIGGAAGIVTDANTGRTATAHDLRRSFGVRWARRVMPATLQQLMRHRSIDTTMT